MIINGVKLDDLALLVRLAEAGSMTVAARQLHLTPAAVSAAVKRIEESRAGDRSAVLLMVARGDSRRFVAVEFER